MKLTSLQHEVRVEHVNVRTFTLQQPYEIDIVPILQKKN